jgi:hypothetical protein
MQDVLYNYHDLVGSERRRRRIDLLSKYERGWSHGTGIDDNTKLRGHL